ncbi:hypothetical protein FQ377_11160 [Arthrobacter echini]|uniref:Uncharacterized protein n=1 Tax=Arthrobacter echini TaxID=1529066 RepID=A0A5D0XPH4_9MICC|nr:hypothetical protein FQ377_11160 [Arthrobacter echini]
MATGAGATGATPGTTAGAAGAAAVTGTTGVATGAGTTTGVTGSAPMALASHAARNASNRPSS